MNSVLKEHIGKYCLVYLDDILVFSTTPEEHVEHLRRILHSLSQHKLYAKLSKCRFALRQVQVLCHTLSADGIQPDPSKVQLVADWPTPKTVVAIQQFMGLANFFRRFIAGFPALAAPITDLTRKGKPFVWSSLCQNSFEAIKTALTSAPVLRLPDLGEDAPPFEVISDACGTGLGCALLQDQRPIAYDGRKLKDAETRYSATEQELLGVIFALKKWRCYLEGTIKPFVMVTDHAPNTFFAEQPKLSARQARWSEFLASYNFQWLYRPGRRNLADPLSRHPMFVGAVTRSSAVRHKQVPSSLVAPKVAEVSTGSEGTPSGGLPLPTMDQPGSLEPMASDRPSQPADVHMETESDLVARFHAAYAADKFIASERKALAGGKLELVDGMWKHGGAFYVPDAPGLRASVIQELHAPAHAGHPGVARTQKLVQRLFWWPSLLADVGAYVRGCVPCQRAKPLPNTHLGKLMALPIPKRIWADVSMDFVGPLPDSTRGFNRIMVVVDRFSKMAHYVPCRTDESTEELAHRYVKRIFSLHGAPRTMVSDRGPEFTSRFLKEVC